MLQRLSDKIAKILAFGAGSVIITLLGLSYYYTDYTSNILLKEKANFIAQSSAAAISVHVWNLDREHTESALRELLKDRDIERIELKEDGGDIIVIERDEGRASSKSLSMSAGGEFVQRDVVYGEGKDAKKIALLTIYYSDIVVQHLQRQAMNMMLVVGCVLFTVLIVFIMRVTRSALKPVEILTNSLLNEEVHDELPAANTLEVQALMEAVKVKQRQNDVHALAIERQMDELKLARIVAEEHARAKADFLSNMSHELRTPMHAIMNYGNMALKRIHQIKIDDERVDKYLNNIQVSGGRLLALINALLDLSKMESGRMQYMFEEDAFTKVIEQSYAELESLFKKKNLKFKLEAPEDVMACFDTHRMIQVVVNIFANAIRYAPEKSAITVRLFEPELIKTAGMPMLQCSIYDEGRGIPEGELERIFDKFIQSSKTTAAAGGTGLGLSICRQIVEAHRGRIWAENVSEGQGAVFHFTLPKTCSVEHAPDIEVVGEVCEIFSHGS